MPKILLPLVAALLLAGPAGAATYRYNGNMPMAKVMLDMMEVLGYVTRVPDPAPYGAAGWRNPLAPWPMTGLWGLNALSPGGAVNPLSGGVPGTGLPGQVPGLPGGTAWPGATLPASPQGTVPVDVNTLTALMRALQNQTGGSGGGAAGTPSGLPAQPGGGGTASLSDLAGVWQGSNQDVLTISGNQFLWSNGRGQTVAGTIAVQGDRLITRVPGVQTPATYTYRLEGDRLVATLPNGQRYEFRRLKP